MTVYRKQVRPHEIDPQPFPTMAQILAAEAHAMERREWWKVKAYRRLKQRRLAADQREARP